MNKYHFMHFYDYRRNGVIAAYDDVSHVGIVIPHGSPTKIFKVLKCFDRLTISDRHILLADQNGPAKFREAIQLSEDGKLIFLFKQSHLHGLTTAHAPSPGVNVTYLPISGPKLPVAEQFDPAQIHIATDLYRCDWSYSKNPILSMLINVDLLLVLGPTLVAAVSWWFDIQWPEPIGTVGVLGILGTFVTSFVLALILSTWLKNSIFPWLAGVTTNWDRVEIKSYQEVLKVADDLLRRSLPALPEGSWGPTARERPIELERESDRQWKEQERIAALARDRRKNS